MAAEVRGWGCVARDGKMHVEELRFMPPGPKQVRVKILACGLCQSDVSSLNGKIPSRRAMEKKTGVVLGHEGAGVIETLGESVSGFNLGDPVLLFLTAPCTQCQMCANGVPALCTGQDALFPDDPYRVHDNSGKELVPFAGLGCMAEYAVVSKNAIIRIEKDVPLDKACLVSCGVTTGCGAVMNRANLRAGSTCCVFGCGGVGISAIQGARICGASQIIAVDALDSKLEAAKRFGATHTVNAKSAQDVVQEIVKLSGGGTDYCFEAVGSSQLAAQCVQALKPGGSAIMIGMGQATEQISANLTLTIVQQKTITGSFMGSCVPSTFLPTLVRLYQKGDLMLNELVSKLYTITNARAAFEDLSAGSNLRGVLVMHDMASLADRNSSKL